MPFLKSHTLKNDELFISLRINLEIIDKHKIYGYLTPEVDCYKWKITWIMWLEFIVSIWVTLFCIEKGWMKILIKVCGFTVLFGCKCLIYFKYFGEELEYPSGIQITRERERLLNMGFSVSFSGISAVKAGLWCKQHCLGYYRISYWRCFELAA